MAIKTQPVSLASLQTDNERPVKSAALAAFRFVREMSVHAKRVPGLMTMAAADIRDAWEESASPKR